MIRRALANAAPVVTLTVAAAHAGGLLGFSRALALWLAVLAGLAWFAVLAMVSADGATLDKMESAATDAAAAPRPAHIEPRRPGAAFRPAGPPLRDPR